MLKDYSKTIYQFNKDNHCISQINASIIDRQLIIQRIDFNDWEYNPRTGKVIGYDSFDEGNTSKLALQLRAYTSPNFIRLLKQEFGTDGMMFFLSNLREYCDDHKIVYTHEAEY